MILSLSDPGRSVDKKTLQLLKTCADKAADIEGIPQNCAASLLFVNDVKIREMNRIYRGIDRATDVLSFPEVNYDDGMTAGNSKTRLAAAFDDDIGGPFLGDIVISTEHAAAQAEEFGHSLSREYAYLTVHGLFHLMGYDHMADEEKRIMRAREEAVLSALGIQRERDDG